MVNRLKKLAIDFSDRDFAIAYINGEIIESSTHANCINEYLISKSTGCLNAVRRRPEFSQIEILDSKNVDELISECDQEDLEIIRDNIKQMAFAHSVDGSNENSGNWPEDGKLIYIEKDTLFNVSFDIVVNAIKERYPDYEIYVEGTNEKIAILKKKCYFNDNNRDMALCYIDGKLITGKTHAECIDKYLKQFNIKLEDTYCRPYTDDNIQFLSEKEQKFLDDLESLDYDLTEEQMNYYMIIRNKLDNNFLERSEMEDYNNVKDNIKQLAFAHIVSEKNAIYIDDSLINVDMKTVGDVIKLEYPQYNVYTNAEINSDCKLVARLKKKAFDNTGVSPNGIIWNDDIWDTYENINKQQKSTINREWTFEKPIDCQEWALLSD